MFVLSVTQPDGLTTPAGWPTLGVRQIELPVRQRIFTMGLGTAFRAFSATLFDADMAQRVQSTLDGKTADGDKLAAELPAAVSAAKPPAVAATSSRSDAVTLLSTLQRESRFLDLVMEDLQGFSDAQVGAAARPCLVSCAAALKRTIGLAAVDESGEGAAVEVTTAGDPRYQWIGEGSGLNGKLIHKGWRATQVKLPRWTGNDQDAMIIAAAQVQR